ncbi:MAG: hypothetical protein AAF244_02235 [Pseudomonadota bacterium]
MQQLETGVDELNSAKGLDPDYKKEQLQQNQNAISAIKAEI